MGSGFLSNIFRFRACSPEIPLPKKADRSVAWQVDERLVSFILVTEVDSGTFFTGELFQRKFGDSPPDFGHHIVAFYRDSERKFLPASYLHLWTQGTLNLLGGVCTDGRVLQKMAPEQLSMLNQAGGLLRQTLGYCFAKFGSQTEAFFIHCGNARAKEVALQAGIRETSVPYLLVRYNRVLTPKRQQALLCQAEAIGVF